MRVVIIVDVVEVVIHEGCCEASKSSLIIIKQNTSPSKVLGLPICSLSSSWPMIVTGSLVLLVVVVIVIVAIVAGVDVPTEVVGEPLEPKWSKKVK